MVRLFSEMTYNVPSGMLNTTHSLTIQTSVMTEGLLSISELCTV